MFKKIISSLAILSMLVQTSAYAQSKNNLSWKVLTQRVETADSYRSLGDLAKDNGLTMSELQTITVRALEQGLVDPATLNEAKRIINQAEASGEILDFQQLTKDDIAHKMTKHHVAGGGIGLFIGGVIAVLLIVLPFINMKNKAAEQAAEPERQARLRATESEARYYKLKSLQIQRELGEKAENNPFESNQ